LAGKLGQAHYSDMKKHSIVSLLIAMLGGLMQPAYAGNSDNAQLPTGGYSSLNQNPLVRTVQIALQKKGYNVGNTDGIFNAETRAAVSRFKRDKGLPETGSITPEVLQALGLS
jgi:peptidoglycan hydrolase-like protein with peptidoglycan-binding domain